MADFVSISILFFLFASFQYCEAKVTEKTAQRLIGKCKRLKIELLRDAYRKIQALQYISSVYQSNLIFQMGLTLSEVKTLFLEVMTLYVKMENLPGKLYQVARCRFLVDIQRKYMQVDHMITIIEENDQDNERRTQREERIKTNMLRTKNVARTGNNQKMANKPALRSAMRNIKDNRDDRTWPKVPRGVPDF